MRLQQRLLGLAASLALVAFTLGVPVSLTLFGLDPLSIASHDVWSNLLAPDDGTMAYVGLGIIAWALWTVLVVCLVVELVAAVRGIHAPEIRGLALPQRAVRTLIAWAALLFVAVPATTSTAVPIAHAADTPLPAFAIAAPARPDQAVAPGPSRRASHIPQPAPTTAPAAAPLAPPAAVPGTTQYVVKRGDSLWKIADTVLGDPLRYTQIAELNADRLGGTPDFITPGTVLLLPTGMSSRREPPGGETYVVQPGDTLSQIAHDELGDATRYPEIIEASRNIAQPDGERLTDPDLIQPGWHLDLQPDDDTGTAVTVGADGAEAVQPPAATPSPDVTTHDPTATAGPPSPPERPAAPDDSRADPSSDTVDDDHPKTAESEAGSLPGLIGPGALLAGALLLVIRAMRRTQLRYRKPGQYLAPPPPDLTAIDRTARTSGAPTAAKIQTLDSLLRDLAGHYPDLQGLPQVSVVELSDDRATLHLASAADLPAPWTGGDRAWTTPLSDPPPATGTAPYPLLVTIGSSDDGHAWLLNLEQTESLAVDGDTRAAEAFVRFVAEELALNPWSTLVSVHAMGIVEELAQISPLRLRYFTEDDPAALTEISRAVDPDSGVLTFDPDGHVVLLTTAARAENDEVRDVIAAIHRHPARPGAAVVTLGAPRPDDTLVTVADGRLSVPALDLDVASVGLTSEEARDVATLALTTEDAPCVPYPADETATEGVAVLADAAGALLPALVEERPADPTEPAGETSLLPLPTDTYVATAPATSEDVNTLAPRVPSGKLAQFEQEHPELDADVADWFAGNDCTRPRLAVLGPVLAHGRGSALAAAKRRPYLTGILGYLAFHPNGVTGDELQTVAGGTSVRDAVKTLRTWIGDNPRTGLPYVPRAGDTRAAAACGANRYQVDDLLVDWELFKLLRIRGELRGTGQDGIADLELALGLVSGVPFSDTHTNWQWLDDTERLDLIAPCAIVDVAHTVVVRAMADCDHALARRAVDVAVLAAPEDEIARLDLIDVLSAEGHEDLARAKLQDDVVDRFDNQSGPIALPARTVEVAKRHT